MCCVDSYLRSASVAMADAADVDLEAQLEALAAIEELKKERDEMLAQRQANGPAATLASRKAHEANKKNLKSDLKKTTAFVKKIRSINTEGLQQCIRDVETLNLTLYISEIVGAIVETAYKATDVPSMVKLCVSLHKRYEEFTNPLLTGLRTALLSAPAEDDKDAGKRKRIQIRFIVELYQTGIAVEESFFPDLLRNLVRWRYTRVFSCSSQPSLPPSFACRVCFRWARARAAGRGSPWISSGTPYRPPRSTPPPLLSAHPSPPRLSHPSLSLLSHSCQPRDLCQVRVRGFAGLRVAARTATRPSGAPSPIVP